MNKIKYILRSIGTRPDTNGNTYWAFSLINTETGEGINRKINGGESNILSIVRKHAPDFLVLDNSYCHTDILKLKNFYNVTKEWNYYNYFYRK